MSFTVLLQLTLLLLVVSLPLEDKDAGACQDMFLVSLFLGFSHRTTERDFERAMSFIDQLAQTDCWPNVTNSVNYITIHPLMTRTGTTCLLNGTDCVKKAIASIAYEDVIEHVSPIGVEDLALFVKFSNYFLRLDDDFANDPMFINHQANLNAILLTDFVATAIAAADDTVRLMLRKYNVTLDIVTVLNGHLLAHNVQQYYGELVNSDRIHAVADFYKLDDQVLAVSPCHAYNESTVVDTTTPAVPTLDPAQAHCDSDCLLLEIVLVLIFSQTLDEHDYHLLRDYVIENVNCMFESADVVNIKILAPFNFDGDWITTNEDFDRFLLSLKLEDLKVNATIVDSTDDWTWWLMFRGRSDLRVLELGRRQPWLLLVSNFGSRPFAERLEELPILSWFNAVRFIIVLNRGSSLAYNASQHMLGNVIRIANTYDDIPNWITCDDDGNYERGFVKIAVVMLFASVCFALVATFVYCYLRRRQLWRQQFRMFRFKHESHCVGSIRPSVSEDVSIDNEWEIDRSKLYINFDEKLGSGAFGDVYKGSLRDADEYKSVQYDVRRHSQSLRRPTPAAVAVKLLAAHLELSQRLAFLREIAVMRRLRCQRHLLNAFGCITVGRPMCLVVEWCPHGDLLSFLRQRRLHFAAGVGNSVVVDGELKRRLGTKDLLSFAWQVADGMTFISSSGYIHRDLAARNVFIDEHWNAKIGDFGLCVNETEFVERGSKLPVKWLAIESLKSFTFTTKSDVWSFGVVLYEIFSLGGVPYQNVPTEGMLAYFNAGQRLERPEHASSNICWHADATQRPEFATLQASIAKILEEATENYGYLEIINAAEVEKD